ncbi:UNKNOWN [Stylonychia lemnae]|uniref:NFX1-type zinc finger-containing protein 1 n=1 Tax=Stylonychia lemnae TaxID=5949 RepID=A0A078AZB4_STYLE|nr:UNKNOWN [Stylonychia lemnae]|eukprot:CDW86153.1 UNKNOWN [Stylonychia lemnae]
MKFQQKKELQSIVYATALNQADVVAMTTTGCAKNSELLKDVNFPIVIVEEAAEVFEGHILTALNEKTEHLVLIGDHMQLRPSPAVYQLEKEYNLSMSMFERLVKSDFKYTTLTNQRRMRPEISQLVKFLYPKLTDDARVKLYPNIRGIEKNLFFMTHSQQEASDDNIQSKYNDYEANMIIKFTSYLLQQKYQASQITILSLYQAQSFHIKNKLKQMFNDTDPINKVKAVTVDNFQGEENDIIILSLVRSNSQNNIGYLKVSNRVCVALSRAKHGMYIFGNSECLIKQKGFDEQGNLWIEVLKYLAKNNYYGDTLNLCCRNHKTITAVKKPEDFDKVAQGGCNRICEIQMSCGHTCKSVCHNYEVTLKDPTGHDSVKFSLCQIAIMKTQQTVHRWVKLNARFNVKKLNSVVIDVQVLVLLIVHLKNVVNRLQRLCLIVVTKLKLNVHFPMSNLRKQQLQVVMLNVGNHSNVGMLAQKHVSCTIAPCTKACPIILDCGHYCIGLCGDQCPSICRECQPDHEAFDSFEGDYQSKFVQIDCGHLFESTYLDNLFKKNQLQEKGIIQHYILLLSLERKLLIISFMISFAKSFKKEWYYNNEEELLQLDPVRKILEQDAQMAFQLIKQKKFIVTANEFLRFESLAKNYDETKDLKHLYSKIPQQFGLLSENWFSCKKNHLFAVGNFDGSKEYLKCPKCQQAKKVAITSSQ